MSTALPERSSKKVSMLEVATHRFGPGISIHLLKPPWKSGPKRTLEGHFSILSDATANGEMVDGYVLKKDFTWHDDTPYYSENAPGHVGFKNTVETDQETSLIQLLGKYIQKTKDYSILESLSVEFL
jgi:hypothetical protein